ncbi:MAG: Ig-like domain-containing protein, partial [Candidatus Thermoplasmatota archaeon]|nr:Ig-like domain-containing protein [Candidatus Thermoplasmatota archaeon]
ISIENNTATDTPGGLTLSSIERVDFSAYGEWRDIIFSASATVTAGTRYWIVAKDGGAAGHGYAWYYNRKNPFPDGNMVYGTPPSWSKLTGTDLGFKVYIVANVTINGSAPGDQFGYSVSGGDLNNDGYNDTIIGAPYNASAKGAVYIFNGSANIPPSLSALDANYTAYGENANDKFGLSVYLAGDINNDNYPDVIIGAPGYSGNKGRVYVYTTQPIGVIDNPPTANANIAPPYWKNSNTFSISWNATDDNNLVSITLYYRYSQDNVSWGSWTEYSSQPISGTSAEGNFTFDGTADGYYEFYVNATDSANQKAQSNIAKAGIDITKATSFVNTISPYWQNSTAFTITANASDYNATGGESGVKNISLYYRYCNDNVSWPPTWSYFDTNSTPSFTDPHNCTVSFTFTSPDGDGYYQFYSIAIDNATNEELAPAEKDALAGVDTQPPGSWSNPEVKAQSSTVWVSNTIWVNESTVSCRVECSDYLSKLNLSSAEYYYSTTSGSSWSGPFACSYEGSETTATIYANNVAFATGSTQSDGDPLRIRFRIKDKAGSWGSYWWKVKIDITAPNNPNSFTSTVPVDTWTNIQVINVTWSGHSDAPSGVAGFYYAWTADSTTIPTTSDNYTTTNYNESPVLPEGYWYLHIRTKDNASNLNTTACHIGPFKIDITPPNNPTPPATETNGAQNNTWQNTVKSPTFKWDWPSDNLAGVEGFYWYFGLSETGTANNYITTNTTSCAGENGTYYFRIMTKDKAGNNASWVTLFVFKHDAQLPTITYNYPTAGSATNWYNADPGNVIDIDFCWIGLAPLDYAQYQINGGTWIDIFTADQSSDYTANWAVAWESLAEGENKISIRVADVAGNILTHTYTAGSFGFLFRKDTVMPSVTIETPQNGTTLYTTPIWINGTCNDTLSGINKVEINITYKENGTVVVQWSPVTLADNYSWWDYQFNPPTEANYTIKVRAVDNASNIATVQINITYSLVVPPKIKEVRLNITETNSAYTNTQIVKLNLTVSATNAIRVMVRFRNEYFDWSDWFEYNISKTYNLFDWILAKADGTKTVYAEVNATGAEGYDLATASDDIILDATPPRIFNLKPEAFVRNITVNISAVLNDTLSGINWTTLLIKINGVDHTKNFTIEKSSGKLWNRALRPDGSYKCYIYVRDNANNSAEIIWTFTLDSTPITPNDIRFSHYNAMPGQRIKINVTIYKNETTHDHVKFRVIILKGISSELYNGIITIARETFWSIEIEDIVEALGEERTDLAGRKYLAGNYTVRVIKKMGPMPGEEIDRQTAILPIVYLKPPPEPVSSFEITLVSVLIAAVLAALISTLKKRQNK